MRYDGQTVLVVGLGASGQAAVRFFARRGARVSVTDRGPAEKLAPAVESLAGLIERSWLGGHPAEAFLQQDIIVVSPGAPWDMPELERARRRGVRVAGELDFAAYELRGKVIGVTGSNGKTTTVSLIGHILRIAGFNAVVGGNIGRPLLDMADESADDQWSVLELSSFQLEAMSALRCHIAAILNITPDHLDRHGDFPSYVAAKARILAAQTAEDCAVLNREDPSTATLAGGVKGRTVWFQRRSPAARLSCLSQARTSWRTLWRRLPSAPWPAPPTLRSTRDCRRSMPSSIVWSA
jgi:UDP-N-acetylmuramoylalanine--D-glutamate ligase